MNAKTSTASLAGATALVAAAHYPNHVRPVGSVVGMIGGLGGFVLPIAFGLLNNWTELWTSCLMLLFLVVAGNLLSMHVAVLRMERAATVKPDRRLDQGRARATT